MNKVIKEGLTFDDVLLVPQKSEVTPDMINLKTRLTKNITLNKYWGIQCRDYMRGKKS